MEIAISQNVMFVQTERLANLNPLKCNESASGKISPTGFVEVVENLESRGNQEFHFKAWKVMEFNCRSLKIMENYSFVW